ncbi:hypothetical protein PLEOSDRAFT_1108721 [Pleurotus ostreatus PC15]|uniref:Fungal-type protein kinase domain-containing protein n=1 Tax=Pleurotus ostreatus (strain PC15) TaxID=1137138 RepID=A0A067N4X6_PLEO1|nr:hypothetical protein PLEOSDRAFT_1108721 [Pleurotus ostreatus PC15]
MPILGDLDGHRTDIVDDLESNLFIVDSLQSWRETYAPPSSYLTESLTDVKKALIEGNLLSPQGFTKILAAQKTGKLGNKIYSHIQEIVTKSQSALRQVSAEYESAPNSDHPSYVTFLDGGIFLAASNEERAADCVAEEDDHEIKIHDSIKNNPKAFFDNIKKAIGAATSTLYNDPCRRHVYAMTLQGKQLRMWYFCRSHIAISLPFNIHKAQDDFVLFLLFLVSATKEELGFDPTVVRVIRRTGTVFRYKVGDVYYATVGDPLNQDAAYHICSRSTRVWKTMEKDIQDQIFGKFDKGTREKVRPHFLTILQDVEVSFKTNDVERKDVTPLATGLSFAILDPVTKNRILKGPRVSKAPLDQGASKMSFQPSREAPKARIHVRTVFKECCEPVYDIADIVTLVKCLDGAIVGLDYLRQAGFVHRDISGGNILWYAPERPEDTTAEVKAAGIGKIADLEYCRPYEDSKPNEPITASELCLCALNQRQIVVSGHTKVSFNFYHDLESLIWVYVWFLFNHVPTSLLVADKGFQKAAKSLRASASRWGLPRGMARTEGILGDDWVIPRPLLEEVRPVVIRQSFASAQRELQKQEPDKHRRRWPREFFKDTPYTGFRDYIATHFESLTSLPVISLSEIIKPESEGGVLRKGSPVPDLSPILDAENEDHEDDGTAAEY